MPEPESRDSLRQHYRHLRRSLSAYQQQHAAQLILKQCVSYPPFIVAQTVALYLSNDGEIDTSALLEYCWQHKKKVLLPVLDPSRPGHLVFVQHHRESALTVNKYGIAEPLYQADKLTGLKDIHIIFTPLVAFDAYGNRLGMGGGYYDRSLAKLKHLTKPPKVIGLAHDCQQSEKLPNQAWDIPLNGIITPSQIFMLE